MRLLLSVVLLCSVFSLYGQRCAWMATSDCGYLINVRQLCTDDAGNVYSAGEFQGEVMFRSAALQDTMINKFTSESWQKTYVARYDVNGRLNRVVQFKSTGSNSDLTYVEGMKALPGGDLVVFVMSNGRIQYVDPEGNRQVFSDNGKRPNLFCIDYFGRIKWSVQVPINHCKFMEVSPTSCIAIGGDAQRLYSADKTLCVYSPNGALLHTINTGGPELSTLCFKDKKMYVVAQCSGNESKSGRDTLFRMKENTMGLYEIDTATFKLKPVFSCDLPMEKGYSGTHAMYFKCCINFTSTNLFVDILLPTPYGNATFAGRQFADRSMNMHLIRLNKEGVAIMISDYGAFNHNYNLCAGPNASVYVMNAAGGTAFKYGSDSIALPKYTDFINELVVMKLDNKFQRVWWMLAGSTASNYHTSGMCIGQEGSLYVHSDLLAPCYALGREIKYPWRCASYLARVEE